MIDYSCIIGPSTDHIEYCKGYKYQLRRDYECKTRLRPISSEICQTAFLRLTHDGRLFIKAAYAWDGASGPTLDTRSTMRASLEHDAKSQLIRLGLVDRKYIPVTHQELYETGIADGMYRWRASMWRKTLMQFGCAQRPSNEPPLMVAP